MTKFKKGEFVKCLNYSKELEVGNYVWKDMASFNLILALLDDYSCGYGKRVLVFNLSTLKTGICSSVFFEKIEAKK